MVKLCTTSLTLILQTWTELNCGVQRMDLEEVAAIRKRLQSCDANEHAGLCIILIEGLESRLLAKVRLGEKRLSGSFDHSLPWLLGRKNEIYTQALRYTQETTHPGGFDPPLRPSSAKDQTIELDALLLYNHKGPGQMLAAQVGTISLAIMTCTSCASCANFSQAIQLFAFQ